MRLEKWLKLKKMRMNHLNKALKENCSSAIWFHVRQGRPVSARLALVIEKYTKGEVTLRELVTPYKKKEVKKEEVNSGHGVDKAS